MTFSDVTQDIAAGRFSLTTAATARSSALLRAIKKLPEALFHGNELQAISAAISRDFAPVFTNKRPQAGQRAKFSASELLEISDWISLVYKPRPAVGSELMLLPVDPEHVYVYWNLEGVKPGLVNINHPDRQLTLRIFSRASVMSAEGAEPASWSDIAIDHSRHQQKIALPIPSYDHEVAYSAMIGWRYRDKHFMALSRSGFVQFPRQDLAVFQERLTPAVLRSLESQVVSSSPDQRRHASGQN